MPALSPRPQEAPVTDPTPVDDISVVGQRRRTPAGSFPPSGGGGSGGAGGIHQNQVEMEDTPPPPMPAHPCNDPETALEWNADAAAAEALRRMQADANDALLDSRERSVVIARDPATGRVYLGRLAVGEPFAGTVGWDFTGINPAHVIGYMHSHPATGPYPSEWDRTEVFPSALQNVELAGGDPNLMRLYLVGTRAEPGAPARLQIRVYNQSNLDGDENNPGPEVNPDAQPCP